MKVGILTFHKADNYGAVLQAYALQTVLEHMGHTSEMIDFCQPPQKLPAVAGTERRGPAAFSEKLRAEGRKRSAHFEKFRAEFLRCSTPYMVDCAEALNHLYDVFLAGSDQIWNAQLPEADGRYFLPFAAPDKRVSYAASFGTQNIPDRLKGWYAKQLSAFRALSVREEQGREIVQQLTGKDCPVCLDPVLLLERPVWERLTVSQMERRYLFLYMVNYDAGLFAQAKAAAEVRSLDLRVATAGYLPQCGFSAWSGVGVLQWLSLIRNAAGVFTNSFHCTAFALLFGRQIYSVPLGGELSARNGRLTELMDLAGIGQGPGEVPPAEAANRFDEWLLKKRRMSLEYLNAVLAGAHIPDSAGIGWDGREE